MKREELGSLRNKTVKFFIEQADPFTASPSYYEGKVLNIGKLFIEIKLIPTNSVEFIEISTVKSFEIKSKVS